MDRVMSKRLRASMRAANRGRSLRPRVSQLPADPLLAERALIESDPPDSERELNESDPAVIDGGSAGAAPASAPKPPAAEAAAPEPPVVEAAPEPVAEAPAVEAPAAEAPVAEALNVASVGARETVREPFARPDAFVLEEEPKAEVPRPEAKADVAPLSDTNPSLGSPLAREFVKLTSGTAPPVQAAVATFKDEPVSRMEAPASAPTMRTERGEEPKKVPTPRVEVVKARAEEPRKAAPAPAPVKAEEPRKAAPAPVKAEEPRRAAPARAEEKKPLPAKKAARSRTDEPESVKPTRRPVPDEELDPSSISAEFFRKDEDSVPPVEEHDEAVIVPVLSPMTLARRARLRRLVAGVIGFASVISIAVIGKAVAASKRSPSATQPVATVVEPAREAPAPVKETIKAPE